MLAGRTTFVIAHRLSTIALADRILVLEHGRLVADGSHAELLETSDLYREIVEKGMPDQVFMTRNAAGGGGPVTALRRLELRRRLQEPADEGASCAGWPSFSRPTGGG